MRALRLISTVTIVLLMVAGPSIAQEKSNVTIKKVRVPQTSPASGEEMYISYCASCHGKDAKGNGPAAPALKTPPTELTSMAKKNGGEFPAAHVSSILTGAGVTAHGSADMPVWGSVFRRMSQGHDSEVQQRVANLTKYLESLQEK